MSMSEEIVHIVPTGEQRIEDIARLVTDVATDRGMDASWIGVERGQDRDVVVAPRSLVVPKGTWQPEYGASGPVQLVDRPADGPDVVSVEDWARVVQYRQ